MKITLLLVIFALSLSAIQAQQKIESAFGIELGKPLPTELVKDPVIDSTCFVTPPIPVPSLKHYMVILYPSNQVFAIVAKGEIESELEAREQFHAILTAITEKYGEADKSDKIELVSKEREWTRHDRKIGASLKTQLVRWEIVVAYFDLTAMEKWETTKQKKTRDALPKAF